MGGGGGWGAVGGVKHPFGLKGQCCAFSKCHELIQSTREAQTAVRSSLVPHAVLLTHPRTMKCTLVVSQHRQKAVCKSRPGNLLSSAWCFWIVHECAYHVQAKDGFQLLCLNGRFSKIRSHIYINACVHSCICKYMLMYCLIIILCSTIDGFMAVSVDKKQKSYYWGGAQMEVICCARQYQALVTWYYR